MTKTKLVGILNVTPNSFSDGGLFLEPEAALKQARKLFADGAAIVDIGAEATNPWAEPLTPAEEWARLEPILPILVKEFPGKLSVDTYHWQTAQKALQLGDVWINDVMTFRDPEMIKVAAKYKATCVVSHAPLVSRSVKEVHTQKIDKIMQISDELDEQVQKLLKAGVSKSKIIVDPGIGFGKTMRLNWQLLAYAKHTDWPAMLGHSRKRFLANDPKTGKEVPGKDKLSSALNLEAAQLAINAGADYLRVHDIELYTQLFHQ